MGKGGEYGVERKESDEVLEASAGRGNDSLIKAE
jgi:hypothetical protein